MTDANRKPWLTASEQIDHLKSRGVHFSLMGEDETRWNAVQFAQG